MGGSSSAAWGQLPATGVSAVALNVTVTQATAPSFLTAWPAGYPRPATSNLNFGPGETVANHVIVRVGKEGWVNFYNLAGQAHVVLDLVGWYGGDDGDQFRGVSPARTLDTRSGKGAPVAAVGPGGTLGLKVAGEGGVPASGVSAVVLNVTATQPTAAAYLTAWPSGTARPQASSLNYVPGQTVSNLVTVKVGEDGKVNLFNSAGAVHLVADVATGNGVPGPWAGGALAAGMVGMDAVGTIWRSRLRLRWRAVAGAGGAAGPGAGSVTLRPE